MAAQRAVPLGRLPGAVRKAHTRCYRRVPHSWGRLLSRGLLASGGALAPVTPAPALSPCAQPEACRTLAPERDKAAKQCCIQLPDGTSCAVAVRSGFSIKEVLAGLCEQHGINGAAVDLFPVSVRGAWPASTGGSGGEGRDGRLSRQRRRRSSGVLLSPTRLDLVPINRSVGLKAKPTKPVTEVLRPVVAKYGLDLGSLLVRLVGVAGSLCASRPQPLCSWAGPAHLCPGWGLVQGS